MQVRLAKQLRVACLRLARRHCEPKNSRLRLASRPSSTCAVITGWLKLGDTRYGTMNVCAFIMRPSSLRRGPHIALHSVCPSVRPSVPLLLPSVTSRHLANYNDARAEGRISYGRLGRTNLFFIFYGLSNAYIGRKPAYVLFHANKSI